MAGLLQDRLVIQRLREAAEKAKCELSSAPSTDVNLPFLTADASGPKHLNIKLTRGQLEKLVCFWTNFSLEVPVPTEVFLQVDGLIDKTKDPCRNALKDAGLQTSDINEVIFMAHYR